MATKPLIIKDWDQGIADSPHKGFQLMKNVNIEDSPGAVMAGFQPDELFYTPIEEEFTANASTDAITIAMPSVQGLAVTFSNAGGALPAGLSAATVYFLRYVDATHATVHTTIANAIANTKVDITGTGTGTHTVATVDPGAIKHILYSGITYLCLDDNGRVWFLSSSYFLLLNGNTLTSVSGNGMCSFVNSDATATYLLVFRNALIDVINITALTNLRTPSWSNGWQSLNSPAGNDCSHHCINYPSEDNIIYFCDSRYVGSIKENSGQVFDPANAATYTYNNQALDLPNGETAYWLETLGTRLLVSANTSDKIYPWDRISDSFYLPLTVPEKEVWKIKNLGNIVYIQAGRNGNIYQTQGSYVRLFKKIPLSVINNSAKTTTNPMGSDGWGGIDGRNGNLIVGIDCASSGNDGVYVFYPDGRFVIDNQPLSGAIKPTALFTLGTSYVMGYEGGAGFGATAGTRYSNYEAVIHSGLYRLATKTEKATFSTLEVVTSQVPSSGTNYVRVKYRTDNNPDTAFSDFPTEALFTFNSTSDAVQEIDIGLIDIENIQIQIELSGNVELVSLRFIP